MTVHPAAMAPANGANVSWNGKFQGEIKRTFPNGVYCKYPESVRKAAVEGIFLFAIYSDKWFI